MAAEAATATDLAADWTKIGDYYYLTREATPGETLDVFKGISVPASWDNDNSQLLLFEKNIINYKDNQLKLLKKLINYFGKKESSFFSKGKININEFYLELSNYNNNKTISYIENDFSKKRKKNIKSNLKLTSFIRKKVSISNKVSEAFRISLESSTTGSGT